MEKSMVINTITTLRNAWLETTGKSFDVIEFGNMFSGSLFKAIFNEVYFRNTIIYLLEDFQDVKNVKVLTFENKKVIYSKNSLSNSQITKALLLDAIEKTPALATLYANAKNATNINKKEDFYTKFSLIFLNDIKKFELNLCIAQTPVLSN